MLKEVKPQMQQFQLTSQGPRMLYIPLQSILGYRRTVYPSNQLKGRRIWSVVGTLQMFGTNLGAVL